MLYGTTGYILHAQNTPPCQYLMLLGIRGCVLSATTRDYILVDNISWLAATLLFFLHSLLSSISHQQRQKDWFHNWRTFLWSGSKRVASFSLIVFTKKSQKLLPELWCIASKDKPPDRKNISSFEKHCVLNLEYRILSQEPSDSCISVF